MGDYKLSVSSFCSPFPVCHAWPCHPGRKFTLAWNHPFLNAATTWNSPMARIRNVRCTSSSVFASSQSPGRRTPRLWYAVIGGQDLPLGTHITARYFYDAEDDHHRSIQKKFDCSFNNGKLTGFDIETRGSATNTGNIYKGRVVDVMPSLNAAFVNYGADKQGFLTANDVNPRISVSMSRN